MVPKSLLDNSNGKLGNFGGGFNRVRWKEEWKNCCLNGTRGDTERAPLPGPPIEAAPPGLDRSPGGPRGILGRGTDLGAIKRSWQRLIR